MSSLLEQGISLYSSSSIVEQLALSKTYIVNVVDGLYKDCKKLLKNGPKYQSAHDFWRHHATPEVVSENIDLHRDSTTQLRGGWLAEGRC